MRHITLGHKYRWHVATKLPYLVSTVIISGVIRIAYTVTHIILPFPKVRQCSKHVANNCTSNYDTNITCATRLIRILYSGAYAGFLRGGPTLKFLGVWKLRAFARGVWGHAPLRKFLKMVQFRAF